MSRNKKIRKDIAGLEREVREHHQKIENEYGKSAPDLGQIMHWETEVRAFQKRIERLLRRLRRNW
jgi:hypothetical protein